MRTELRAFGVVVLATMVLAGCGDGDDTVVIADNGNDNTIRLTATPFAGTPTTTPTPQPTATPVQATETPAGGPTATPGPGATETEPGPTTTPGPGATRTSTPSLTGSPTPAPTATGGGAATCGNSVKESGEQCDTGSVFSTHADCGGEQCACCLCRPDSIHASVPMTKCSTCHPSIAPDITFPAGAAQTFPGLCE